MSVFARTRILILTLLLIVPAFASAALIDINTADVALLDTLPGIGPTKAQAIVDYRTVNGPFARIEDIQNVSGIGASTYAQIESYITVGSAAAPAATSTSTPVAAPGAPSYIPPPSAITIDIGPDRTAYLNTRTTFRAEVSAKSGASDEAARILWSFGDGSAGEGKIVEKTYRYPGTYLVTATAADGTAEASASLALTAEPLRVSIADVTGDGVVIANENQVRIDMSGWRVTSGTGTFRMPPGTAVLPGARVLFPFSIMNLPVSYDVALAFPDGILAAIFAPPQPQVEAAGSFLVQPPRTDITSEVSEEPHVSQTIIAPTASTEVAAVGAALREAVPAPEEGATPTPYWLYGLMAIAMLAGGAFVFL